MSETLDLTAPPGAPSDDIAHDTSNHSVGTAVIQHGQDRLVARPSVQESFRCCPSASSVVHEGDVSSAVQPSHPASNVSVSESFLKKETPLTVRSEEARPNVGRRGG